MKLAKAELILPLTIVLAAVALGASEFMTTFEFTPPGGDPISDQLAGDRHGYAMLLLAVFAVASLVIAVAGGQRAAAWATAGFGVAALALFLARRPPRRQQARRRRGREPRPDHRRGRPPARLLARGGREHRPRPGGDRLRRPGRRAAPGTAAPARVPPLAWPPRAPPPSGRLRDLAPTPAAIPPPKSRKAVTIAGFLDLGGLARGGRRWRRRWARGDSGWRECRRYTNRERTRSPRTTSGSGRRPCWPGPCGRCRPCACRRRPAGRRRP